MSEFFRVAQGIQTIVTCTVVDSAGNPIDYSATSPALTAEVWPGSTLAVTFVPSSAVWANAALGTINVTFATTDTSSILPGFYEMRIRATDSSAWMWQGFIEIVASPSSATVILADLCTVPYAHAALSTQPFSDDEWQYLPYAIHSATDMIRRWCNRIFNRQSTYIETLTPDLDGAVRLKEIPVNVVARVAGNATNALTIYNNSQSVQQARVVFSTTGNLDEPGGITVTGLTLTSVSSGVTTTTNFLWTSYLLVADLAAAINALGSGWNATINTGFDQWLSSELIGATTAQGCSWGSNGAVLQIFAQDLAVNHTDYETGLIWVGSQSTSQSLGPRWGYNWLSLDDVPATLAPVRVYYDAGFDTIPDSIQSACAELAKTFIYRFRQNPLFKSEQAHQYQYDMRDMILSLPEAVQQTLALYRIHNA